MTAEASEKPDDVRSLKKWPILARFSAEIQFYVLTSDSLYFSSVIDKVKAVPGPLQYIYWPRRWEVTIREMDD